MRLTWRRSDEPSRAKRRAERRVEMLESRQLLSGGASPLSYYLPTTGSNFQGGTSFPSVAPLNLPIGATPSQLSALDYGGKTVSGVDRQGDSWTLTLHGPGSIIVSDTTPNDGVYNDQINTIQLIGTSLKSSYLTGSVAPSPRVQSNGTIDFQHLIDLSGIKSIQLNGFVLVPSNPPTGAQTQNAIQLSGGVSYLSFAEIDNQTNIGGSYQPINIVIGDPTTPLRVKPTIVVNSIQNTVINSSQTGIETGPQITPTIQFLINGEVRNFDVASITSESVQPAYQFEFPTVGVTGRTSLRAIAVGNLEVYGAAKNFTVARGSFPFLNGFSGVKYIHNATFGGTADAVGLNSSGPIGRLTFLHGLGDPSGVNVTPSQYGTPPGLSGYPASGLLGGLVTASHIGRLTVAPSGLNAQYSENPQMIQRNQRGYITYTTRPGSALTSAVIVSSGSIGKTTIIGNSNQSEIKSGFSYTSFLAGLEPSRAPSHIGPIRYRGDLINSAIAATYRTGNGIYGGPGSFAGPGKIKGVFQGAIYSTGIPTGLNHVGTGFYARRKEGYLPPPQRLTRFNNPLIGG